MPHTQNAAPVCEGAPKGAPEAVPEAASDYGLQWLPHRPPMRLLDHIVALEPGLRAHGSLQIRPDAIWLSGHFPGHPIFPAVLIVEALAQTACVLASHSADSEARHRMPYLVGIDKARFRQPVRPGDRLDLHVRRSHAWGAFWKLQAHAEVAGVRVAEVQLLATFVDTRRSALPAAALDSAMPAKPATAVAPKPTPRQALPALAGSEAHHD